MFLCLQPIPERVCGSPLCAYRYPFTILLLVFNVFRCTRKRDMRATGYVENFASCLGQYIIGVNHQRGANGFCSHPKRPSPTWFPPKNEDRSWQPSPRFVVFCAKSSRGVCRGIKSFQGFLGANAFRPSSMNTARAKDALHFWQQASRVAGAIHR